MDLRLVVGNCVDGCTEILPLVSPLSPFTAFKKWLVSGPLTLLDVKELMIYFGALLRLNGTKGFFTFNGHQ